MRREDIELMAPAGDFESLMAAIQGHADAVYFGVGKLNMRSGSAKNFTEDDLPEIASICKKHKIRSYLTVNTVLYDKDLDNMKFLVLKARDAGISAIIATDHAAIGYARSIDMPVHISTQTNISNVESVKFYSQFADVMVLARELNVNQMKHITEQIRVQNICGPSGQLVRIEVFTHGALCMAISGKCYLSLHQNHHSANRGKCRQECRKAYTVTEKETGQQLDIDNEYIMSPKDLCTIDFLDTLTSTGVSILKIEGRGRSPEYVKKVASTYHEALVAIEQGHYTPGNIEKWKDNLDEVFNRGFWDGYYLGRKLGKWSEQYGSSAKKRKVYIGKSTNYFSKLGVAEFVIEANPLNAGDEILIIGPTTGVVEAVASDIRVDLKSVDQTVQGERCSIAVPEKIRRSDKLYKVVAAGEIVTQ